MYGDNQNIFLGGIILALFLLLGTLSLVSLVKIHRLEEKLLVSPAAPAEEAIAEIPEKEIEKTGEVEEQSFYRALDLWKAKGEQEAEARLLGEDLQKENWDFLAGLNLELVESSSLYSRQIAFRLDGEPVPLFTLGYEEEAWRIISPDKESLSFSHVNGRVEKFISEGTSDWLERREKEKRASAYMEELIAGKAMGSLLAQKKCRLIGDTSDNLLKGFKIVTKEDERTVLTALWDGGRFLINGEACGGEWEDFGDLFLDRLARVDTRREEEILLSRGLDRIRALYGDKNFLKRLDEEGLTPVYLEREDNDFVYLDLQDASGTVRASFAVKKYTGDIHIMDGNDIPLASLESLNDSGTDLPDNLADLDRAYADGDSFTVLLIGYHNRGTDTMILAHVNGREEKISLISIPRDLWWEGQKLNSYYFGSGREDFLGILTQVTGVRVDYYLSVDMYAFIDVVNALGGIDVTLEDEVRDPTYKVIRENGTEGTLYYPPGTYHLGGVEALRLARSRHGSSDFERSLLQQQILSSLRDRAGELSLRDGGTFRRFFSIALERTETNMPLPFMIRNLPALKDYDVDGGHNLNDPSLIYNTYSNYCNLSAAELSQAREDDNFSRGQWILLPLGNDWDLIKTRIRQILQG